MDRPQARGASVVLRESLGRLGAADCDDMMAVLGMLAVILAADVIAAGDATPCAEAEAARWQVDDEDGEGEETWLLFALLL